MREDKVLTLPEAIRRMTSAVAEQFQIADRGAIRAGAFADIVAFDPATVGDTATYERPPSRAADAPQMAQMRRRGRRCAETGRRWPQMRRR